ncbi:hypothetical protein [Rhizobium sp. BT03]|uniref:hypothetical protein n=1 Tax=Rhizobium sp. BT03 TaxID=3045156 RepID=UPI0024B3E001|nr:hypothetical protein [Rhizobium sp. BT03]WHO71741.1 hypothetical protein QMO80_000750 [Rhizobium sp. BT03]
MKKIIANQMNEAMHSFVTRCLRGGGVRINDVCEGFPAMRRVKLLQRQRRCNEKRAPMAPGC